MPLKAVKMLFIQVLEYLYYSLVELILQNIYNEKVAHIADI